jgi:ubiquinone/menaquinone biosynthesis C-methylase UbiE
MDDLTASVKDYWDAHTLGKQYIKDESLKIGSLEFFEHIRPWMNPYKFPEIMPRISKNAKKLKGKHLLEVGCGMGFDSAEFMKRGVRVTATDLTPNAIELAKKHFKLLNLKPESVETANVLNLHFKDNTFDAVWACGVLHHTGNTQRAIDELFRVLKPGGRAIVSHLYRRPSWMFYLSKYGKENIEFKEEDPPVTDFLTEEEILPMFSKFSIEETAQDHYRLLPVARTGLKAFLYMKILKPAYNLIPEAFAKKLAYKFSVTAIKK